MYFCYCSEVIGIKWAFIEVWELNYNMSMEIQMIIGWEKSKESITLRDQNDFLNQDDCKEIMLTLLGDSYPHACKLNSKVYN